MLLNRPSLHLLLWSVLLTGCEFFVTQPEPPPDPNGDGLLVCGETEDLSLWDSQGENLALEVPLGWGFEVIPSLGDGSQLTRLQRRNDTILERRLELWDPTRGLSALVGQRTVATEDFAVEFLGGSEGVTGTIEMTCAAEPEFCNDLSDNDGDELIDCADFDCSGHPGCAEDQDTLATVELSCSDGLGALTLPSLSALDDQRTLYGTETLEATNGRLAFWGGAEIALVGLQEGLALTMEFDNPGLLCAGSQQESLVDCAVAVEVNAGESHQLTTSTDTVWLEPLGPAWGGVRAWLDCE